MSESRGLATDARRWNLKLSGIGATLTAILIVHLPQVSEACAVCSAGRDEENAAAFLISTIFMSLTPLIVIGSIIYLLYRRIQKFDAEKEARLQESTSVAPRSLRSPGSPGSQAPAQAREA